METSADRWWKTYWGLENGGRERNWYDARTKTFPKLDEMASDVTLGYPEVNRFNEEFLCDITLSLELSDVQSKTRGPVIPSLDSWASSRCRLSREGTVDRMCRNKYKQVRASQWASFFLPLFVLSFYRYLLRWRSLNRQEHLPVRLRRFWGQRLHLPSIRSLTLRVRRWNLRVPWSGCGARNTGAPLVRLSVRGPNGCHCQRVLVIQWWVSGWPGVNTIQACNLVVWHPSITWPFQYTTTLYTFPTFHQNSVNLPFFLFLFIRSVCLDVCGLLSPFRSEQLGHSRWVPRNPCPLSSEWGGDWSQTQLYPQFHSHLRLSALPKLHYQAGCVRGKVAYCKCRFSVFVPSVTSPVSCLEVDATEATTQNIWDWNSKISKIYFSTEHPFKV